MTKLALSIDQVESMRSGSETRRVVRPSMGLTCLYPPLKTRPIQTAWTIVVESRVGQPAGRGGGGGGSSRSRITERGGRD